MRSWRADPRAVGIACAIAAVALGMGYLAAAGAPARHLMVNGGALAIGLLLFAAMDALGPRARGPGAMLFGGIVLMATALFGFSADGAARWASLGPILLQPSLILLPMLAVSLARSRGPVAAAGVILAAAALALQPDRAMAGALAASVAAAAALKPDRWTLGGLVAAIAGFAATLLRPDDLPAVPFVDGVLHSSFGIHPLAGAAVLGGTALLLVPAIAGWRDPERRSPSILLGTVWLAIIAAAALGNYPTPLVGYGGSAIIGYLLALGMLPKAPHAATAPAGQARPGGSPGDDGSSLAVGRA